MTIPQQVSKFYENPKFVGDWQGYQVYAESYGGDSPSIGLPQFVLYKDNSARLSTVEEAFEFIKASPDKD